MRGCLNAREAWFGPPFSPSVHTHHKGAGRSGSRLWRSAVPDLALLMPRGGFGEQPPNSIEILRFDSDPAAIQAFIQLGSWEHKSWRCGARSNGSL